MRNLREWLEARPLSWFLGVVAYVTTGVFTAIALVACLIAAPLCNRSAMGPKDGDGQDELLSGTTERSS